MHENAGITYLVLQEDSTPRVCIQNLTKTNFEVVEPGMVGFHGCVQRVPALHEVVYDPPSLAKLYPLVYDEDIASDQDKRLQEAARNVRIKLRMVGTGAGGLPESERWSVPILIVQCHDEECEVPGFGRLMASVSCSCGNIFISLMPSLGVTPYQVLTSRLGVMSSQDSTGLPEFELSVLQMVVLLCDDTRQSGRLTELLRIVVSDLEVSHSYHNHNSKIDVTLKSLRVDNMIRESLEEFAVAFLPRFEHAPPQQLIKQSPPPLLKLQVDYNPHATFQISSIYVSLQPSTFQLEDDLLQRVKSVLVTFRPPGIRVADSSPLLTMCTDGVFHVNGVSIPSTVLDESRRDAYPVSIASFTIEPISIYVSANINLRAYLSCKDTPFGFNRYELVNVFSNWPEVSQIVAAKYMSALLMHIGWVLGSLELIGSPVSFIQSVSRGLSDLVRLPYEGLTRSPGLFILGIGQGTASFVRQFSSGALGSVTNMATSVARNMEHLSMDPDHATYLDRQRREKPTTRFSEGVISGVSSLGLNLVSAVAGLVEQPVQSFLRKEESAGTTSTLLKGVGKGLLGVVTKPVGGAMDLVSKTGQGIMRGAGLAQELAHWEVPRDLEEHVRVQERASLRRSCGSQAR
jgi:vacuolar protein sorting-associated protein 13B